MSLGSYDSPTFLGQKDKYFMGLSLPELMISLTIGGILFLFSLALPIGLLGRMAVVAPLTGGCMLFIFLRIAGMSIPSFLLRSLLGLFRRPSFEENREGLLAGTPAWLAAQALRESGERGSRRFGLVGRGRKAVAAIPEERKAELQAEVDRQVVETAAAAEGWARDAIRSVMKGG